MTPKRPDATCLIFERSESPCLEREVDDDVALADDVAEVRAFGDRFAPHLGAIARRVLAAFAGVRLAADPVHRDGERRVRLGRDRAERHRAGREALDDLGCRLDLVDRNRLRRIDDELEQAAQRHVARRLVVDEARVLLVGLVAVRAHAVLQLGDRVGRPRVLLAAHAPGVLAAGVEHFGKHRVVAERGAVHADRLFGDAEDIDSADLARRAAEVLLDQRLLEPDRLEELCAAVRHVRRDAHLRHDLRQALADRLDVVRDRLVGAEVGRQILLHRDERLEREIRMHRLGAVAGEHREVMDLARRAGLDHQARGRPQAFAHEVLVHGRKRQHGRQGDVLAVDRAVAQDQDVVAAADRVDALGAERCELRLDRLGAPGKRIRDVELVALELGAGVRRDRTQAGHVGAVEDRLRDLEPHRRIDGVDVEQVGLRTDERHQRHDDRLADRIDRRVRDLREQLLEVVVERLVLVGEDGERRVVAHRADAFLAGLRHRAHQELDVFLGVAERLLAVEQRLGKPGRGRPRRQVFELDAHAVDPLPVRLGRRELVLQLLVVDDPALLEVDQEHLAGLQAPFLDDAVLGDRQHAALRAHDDEAVVGDEVARGPEAVAVERRADLAAVGEDHRRRAVPRLHHRRVVLVEGAPARVHLGVLLPRLGDHHHHRVGERVAAHRQQLERVVEGRGVALTLEGDRVELLQVGAEHGRLHHALARAHPVEVALDGVDLAVVRDHPVRVRERPLGEGVGREALVDEGERGREARIGEILVVLADLVGEQQPLVDHRAAAHARHVVLAAVRELERLDRARRGLADDVELPLERIGDDDVGAAADEDLPDDRLLGAHRWRHRHLGVDRDVAPAEDDLALGAHGALELLRAGKARGVFLRQEHHPDPVLAGRGKDHALGRHLGAVEVVRDLDQDAGAVAHQRVGTDRAAVVQVLEDLEPLRDDRVRLAPRDVGDEADAARVVLVLSRVEPGGRRDVHFCLRRQAPALDFAHGVPRLFHRGRRIPQCSNSAAAEGAQ